MGRRRTKFQYPLRVEVGCSSRNVAPLLAVLIVSVPSTGRSGLPDLEQRYLDKLRELFQYPLRVEVGCRKVW